MAKKNKLPVSIFELVWYPICALVILWGLTYVILGLVTKYNNISALTEFNTNFTKQFGLSLYFWGLIIVVIGVVHVPYHVNLVAVQPVGDAQHETIGIAAMGLR